MKYTFTVFLLGIMGSLSLCAQSMPAFSITLFELDLGNEKPFQNAQYLTDFNPNGYNNQPSFFDANTIYLTSDWNSKGQTDIVKLNLLRNAVLKVTDTGDSEFSPTLTPDGRHFSTITVPGGEVGDAPQLLWKYPIDRSGIGSAVTYGKSNVGYHCWLNQRQVALFLVQNPISLVLYDVVDDESIPIEEKVGRCLKKDSQGNLVFVHKTTSSIWYLKRYNPQTGRTKIIAETRKGSEDFEILENGNLIMARLKMDSDG